MEREACVDVVRSHKMERYKACVDVVRSHKMETYEMCVDIVRSYQMEGTRERNCQVTLIAITTSEEQGDGYDVRTGMKLQHKWPTYMLGGRLDCFKTPGNDVSLHRCDGPRVNTDS